MPDEDNFFTLLRLDDAEAFFEAVLQTVDEEREELNAGRLIPALGQVLSVMVRGGDFVALCHFRQKLAQHGELSYLAYNSALNIGRLVVPLDQSLKPQNTGMWQVRPRLKGRVLETDRYDDIESSRS
jgi:hypothetical protein